MRSASIAGATGASAIALLIFGTQTLAHSANDAASAEEIIQALRGKVCTTRAGATFVFGPDGQYGYDGLWKSGGRYVIGDGVITVTLDSGLERSFEISRHGDVFYMEETALYCRTPEPLPS